MANRKYPRVELRNVKHAAFQSHETQCFTATVYLDGVKAGTAENNGTGGMTFIHPRTLLDTLNAYGATFPDEERYGITMKVDGEWIINALLDDWLLARDIKRDLTKKVIYLADDGNLRETKAMPNLAAEIAKGEAHIRSKMAKFANQPVKILNFLPIEEAMEIYRAAAERQ